MLTGLLPNFALSVSLSVMLLLYHIIYNSILYYIIPYGMMVVYIRGGTKRKTSPRTGVRSCLGSPNDFGSPSGSTRQPALLYLPGFLEGGF